MMEELIQAGAQSWYLDGPAKIGIWAPGGDDVWLIDSGNDKDAGRKMRKLLDQRGWHLRGILVTHSNADHIGGCQYLQRQTGCQVFSGGVESAFTKFPILEPSFLYGGYPCADLRHKFLMAAESTVTDFSSPDFPKEIERIPLPGHFFDMVGFRLPDDTVFLADCLSSAAILEKYQISFIYDVMAYLKTLDLVEGLTAARFIPSHAEVTDDIRPLVRLNRDKVQEIGDTLVRLCAAPRSFEDLLQEVFTKYGLTMNFEQYCLIGSTVRSYLSWLKDTGRLDSRFDDNRMLWQAAAIS